MLNHVTVLIKAHAVHAIADVLEAESILAEISQQTFRNTSAGDVQVRLLQNIFVCSRPWVCQKRTIFFNLWFCPI